MMERLKAQRVEEIPGEIRAVRFRERADPEKAITAADRTLRHIPEARVQVATRLAERPGIEEFHKAAAMLGECHELVLRTRNEIQRALDALYKHPIGYELTVPTDHPLLRDNGTEQRLLRDFNGRIEWLVKKKQREEAARQVAAAAREELELVQREHRENAERRAQAEIIRSEIKDARLGLGMLPATRARNRTRLEAAQETIRTAAAHEVAIALSLRRAEENVEQAEVAVRQSTAETVHEENALRKTAESFFSVLGAEKPLDDFQAAVRTAAEKIDVFDREIEARIFTPLLLSEADETRFKSDPVPSETPRFVLEARERSFENIRNLIGSFTAYFSRKGKTMQEIARDLTAAVSAAREDPYVGWNERVAEIEAVLQSGEIKPAPLLAEEFASRSATGAAGMYRRREVEQSLGFERDEYPIYAAYGTARDRDHGPAGGFGAIHLSFPMEQFRFRAACTLGDSLNPYGTPYSMGSLNRPRSVKEDALRRNLALDHAPLARALLDLDERYEPKRGRPNVNFISELCYVETQISGTVRVSDASELVLSRDRAAGEIESLTKRFPGVSEFSRRLGKQGGRSVRIAGEPHVFDPATLEKSLLYRDSKASYERWFQK